MPGSLPTASPPIMSPGGTGAHFNYEVWEEGFDGATYQKLQFLSRVSTSKRPYSKVHGRKTVRLGVNTLGASDPGTGLLYQNPVGAEWTVTPSSQYVAVGWQYGEEAMTNVNLDADLGNELEQALAEASEQSGMANIAVLTQFRGNAGYDVEAGGIRNALALLGRNTNGKYAVGDDPIYGILDWSQYGPLMSIPEFTNAEQRGDSENPNVKGMWSKGGGVMMMLTTVASEDGNGTHGALWVRDAFVVAWNRRSSVYRQDLELQNRLIVANNFGTGVRHDLRAVGIRTNNVIPA